MTINLNLKSRLETAVISYLKGVRNELQFFEVLNKKVEQGGLGLNSQQADSTVKKIESFKQNILSQGKTLPQVVDEYQRSIGRANDESMESAENTITDLEIDHGPIVKKSEYRPENSVDKFYAHKNLDELKNEVKHDLNMPLAKHIDYHQLELRKKKALAVSKQITKPENLELSLKNEASPPKLQRRRELRIKEKELSRDKVKVVEVPKQIRQMVEREVAETKVAPLPIPTKKPTPLPVIKKSSWIKNLFKRKKKITPPIPETATPISIKTPTRPRLDDIKYTPKVYTPVEELANLNIVDFRRMHQDPKSAVVKIIDKLNILAQDSLTKKNEGIEALKKSELYRAYSAIMSLALSEGINFSQAVAKQDRLNKEEFEAIMELNRKLSY